MAWREHRVLLLTGAWEHPWQRNKVTNYKVYISMMEDDSQLEKHYKMDNRQDKCRWRGAVGLRCWAARYLCELCQSLYPMPCLGSALGRETWGKVLCQAGQLCEVKCVLSLQEGLETSLELLTSVGSCPRRANSLSGALGGRGSSGELAAASAVALLGGRRWWQQLSRTCGTSACWARAVRKWVLLCLRSSKFLPEKAVYGKASAGLNQFLLDSQGCSWRSPRLINPLADLKHVGYCRDPGVSAIKCRLIAWEQK